MKKLYLVLVSTLMAYSAFTQVSYPNFQDTLKKVMYENTPQGFNDLFMNQLDSNAEYRNVKEGVVMQGGQLKIVRIGKLFLLTSPVTLKNGTIVMTNGIVNMTNGSTPTLNEGDYIDMNDNIRPIQRQINN
jgi:hypothetical protein